MDVEGLENRQKKHICWSNWDINVLSVRDGRVVSRGIRGGISLLERTKVQFEFEACG